MIDDLNKGWLNIYPKEIFACPVDWIHAASDVSNLFDKSVTSTTLYALCEAPRYQIVDHEISTDGKRLTFKTLNPTNNQVELFPFDLNVLGLDFLNKIDRFSIEDNSCFTIHVGEIPMRFNVWSYRRDFFGAPSDLNVVYVGKGKGKNYRNGSLDRLLKGHHILPKAQSLAGDKKQVILIMFQLQWEGFKSSTSDRLDTSSWNHKMIHQSSAWITDIFEAMMINYFQPRYNDTYKITYKTSKIIALAEKLKVPVLTSSINTSPSNIQLSSPQVPGSYEHDTGRLVLEQDKVKKRRKILPIPDEGDGKFDRIVVSLGGPPGATPKFDPEFQWELIGKEGNTIS